MKLRIFVSALALTMLGLATPTALATNANGNHDAYTWHVGVPFVPGFPAFARAAGPTGTIQMSGSGQFQAGPHNSASGGGTYVLLDAQGNPITGSGGTWSVVPGQQGMLGFVSYGCGNLGPNPVPPDFCGGEVKLRIVLVGGALAGQEGVLTIMCLVGSPPGGKDEGIKLILGNGTNFPQTEEGATLFIKS
jgi:hypothetical protein